MMEIKYFLKVKVDYSWIYYGDSISDSRLIQEIIKGDFNSCSDIFNYIKERYFNCFHYRGHDYNSDMMCFNFDILSFNKL